MATKLLEYLNKTELFGCNWKAIVEYESENGACGVYEPLYKSGFPSEMVYTIVINSDNNVVARPHRRVVLEGVMRDCAIIADFAGATSVKKPKSFKAGDRVVVIDEDSPFRGFAGRMIGTVDGTTYAAVSFGSRDLFEFDFEDLDMAEDKK